MVQLTPMNAVQFVRGLVHATPISNIYEISAKGIESQRNLQSSDIARTHVHMTGAHPGECFSYYQRVAKSPEKPMAYIYLEQEVLEDPGKPVFLSPAMAILTRHSVSPRLIKGIGIWIPSMTDGTGSIKMVYSKYIGDLRPIYFVKGPVIVNF